VGGRRVVHGREEGRGTGDRGMGAYRLGHATCPAGLEEVADVLHLLEGLHTIV
jgi:hypothetical protein